MSNATKKDNSYYFPSRFDIGEEVLFDGRNGQTKIKAKVVAVNCDDDNNKPICGQMGIQGFPTIKVFYPL